MIKDTLNWAKVGKNKGNLKCSKIGTKWAKKVYIDWKPIKTCSNLAKMGKKG